MAGDQTLFHLISTICNLHCSISFLSSQSDGWSCLSCGTPCFCSRGRNRNFDTSEMLEAAGSSEIFSTHSERATSEWCPQWKQIKGKCWWNHKILSIPLVSTLWFVFFGYISTSFEHTMVEQEDRKHQASQLLSPSISTWPMSRSYLWDRCRGIAKVVLCYTIAMLLCVHCYLNLFPLAKMRGPDHLGQYRRMSRRVLPMSRSHLLDTCTSRSPEHFLPRLHKSLLPGSMSQSFK